MAEYLTNESGDPSRFWAYADEDHVGEIGRMAKIGGGKRIASTTPETVIQKMRIRSK